MTECREWTQPDGDHFHGLCSNEFWPKPGTRGCNLCVNPKVVAQPRCNCYGLSPVGVGIHMRQYLLIDEDAIDPYLPACWLPLAAGRFTLNYSVYGAGTLFDFAVQGYASSETTLAVVGSSCYSAGSVVPGYESYGPVPRAPLWYTVPGCTQFQSWPLRIRAIEPYEGGWAWPRPTTFPPFTVPPVIELNPAYQLCADKPYTVDVNASVSPFATVGQMSSHPIP